MESISLRRAARHGVRLIVALILSTFTVLPQLVAAQSTPPFEVYHSSEFGYLFWWDPTEWSVQEQVAESGSDWVQLAHGDSVTDIWGYTETGVTAESCVNDALSEITKDASLVRYEALGSPGSEPNIYIAPNGLSASTRLVLAFDAPEGRRTYAAQVACDAIVSGERVLYTSVWTPAETFNAQNGEFEWELLSTLTLPRVAYDFVPGAFFPEGPRFTGVKLASTADGDELGLFTFHHYTCTPRRSWGFFVAVENTSFSNMVIAPSNFVAVRDGVISEVTFERWLWPAIDSAESAVVQSGEVALLQFAPDFDREIYYVDESGISVNLGYLGGCGVAGAPVLIDLE